MYILGSKGPSHWRVRFCARLMGVVCEAVSKCIIPTIRKLVKRAMRWFHEHKIAMDPRPDDPCYCEAVRKHFVGRNAEPFWKNLEDPKAAPHPLE